MKSTKDIYELFKQNSRAGDIALEIPAKKNSFTFGQLKKDIERLSENLEKLNQTQTERKIRVLVFVPVEYYFHSLVFALFNTNIIPIFMDPGMGKKNILKAIKSIQFDYFITINRGLLFFWLYRKHFPQNCQAITIRSLMSDRYKLKKSHKKPAENKPVADDENLAAVLFTSGGTGTPKGVHYTPDMFLQQIHILQKIFSLDVTQTDFAGFPLFGLFTLAMGLKVVVPQINFAAPAKCRPELIVEDLLNYSCTFLAGSPAIWEKVADYCLENHKTLPKVKNLVMFGAPIKLSILEKLIRVAPLANIYSPYGATESLPVAMLNAKVIIGRFKKEIEQGGGMVLGKPLGHVNVLIVRMEVDYENVESLDAEMLAKTGEIGHVFVDSATTSSAYSDHAANKKFKKNYAGKLYHYMGDLGKIDEEGYLWFCGRHKHVVYEQNQPIFPIMHEYVYNQHPMVFRSAVVKNSDGDICLVIQRRDQTLSLNRQEGMEFNHQLDELAAKNIHSQLKIKNKYLLNQFPVDGRHNIKIDRPLLGEVIKKKGHKIK